MLKHPIYVMLLVMALALGGNAYGFDPLGDPALMAWWSFDEGTGTIVADRSPNGYDGTFEGGVSWAPGRFGNAIELDGSSGYISVPDFVLTTDTITFVAWVNGSKAANWAAVLTAHPARLEMCFGDNDTLHYAWNDDSSTTWSWTGGPSIPEDTWAMLALTIDSSEAVAYVYTDAGGLAQGTNAIAHIEQTLGALQIGWSFDTRYVQGLIDEAAVYSRALTADEMLVLTRGPKDPALAKDPVPENEATDVSRDTDLVWNAGEGALAHDVYLGTSFDDVNDGAGTLVSPGQATTSYDPGRLEFGQTYYWRVDEQGGPEGTIKGEVWNFTIEPFAYAATNVAVTTNATSEAGSELENLVNGSGLNSSDQHSVDSADMWQGRPVDGEPIVLDFAFDSVYKLYQMLVWNYNVAFELMLGFGVKDVTIEYSADGAEWTALGDFEFAQATAKATYAANTTVDFGGVAVRYVRLTVNSGYGGLGQYGLSEVRFLHIPVQAREPQPADGETNTSLATDLSWRAGREAATHEVALGTDPDALAVAGTVAATSYNPGVLDLDTTYYWQVTEVNEAEALTSWAGSVWSFTTQEFLVVDDFESYTDDEGGRIYEAWEDGWINGTGSTVGNLVEPFAETSIVNSGRQAMPLFYDNAGVAVAEAELKVSQDWTASNVQSLSLYFHGDEANTGQLYLKINGTRIDYTGDSADITIAQWQPWIVDLATVGANLSQVTSLIIGIDGANAAGTLYVDDICLYPNVP